MLPPYSIAQESKNDIVLGTISNIKGDPFHGFKSMGKLINVLEGSVV